MQSTENEINIASTMDEDSVDTSFDYYDLMSEPSFLKSPTDNVPNSGDGVDEASANGYDYYDLTRDQYDYHSHPVPTSSRTFISHVPTIHRAPTPDNQSAPAPEINRGARMFGAVTHLHSTHGMFNNSTGIQVNNMFRLPPLPLDQVLPFLEIVMSSGEISGALRRQTV